METTVAWPLSVISDPTTGDHIRDDRSYPFWAKITGNLSGAYSWVEQIPQQTGTFVDLPEGRSGTTTDDPAYEESMNNNVPVGTYVRMKLGYFNSDTGSQEYLFSHCCQ